MAGDVGKLVLDFREQWDQLRAWLEELPDDVANLPSPLPGWRVPELLAHLGRTIAAVGTCRPAPAGADPLSLSEYLAGYVHDAARSADAAPELVAALEHGDLTALDDLADVAFAQLAELFPVGERDLPVLTQRGAMMLSDVLASRLTELVLHAEDLARLLPLPAPVDATARTLVADALLEVLRRRTGADVTVGDARAFVLLMAGRITWAQGVAAGALRPGTLSDGLPDLADALPLLD